MVWDAACCAVKDCIASQADFGNDQSHRYLSSTRCGGRSYPVVSVQSGSKDRAVADSARKFQRDSACGIRGGEVSILIHRERSNGISEHVLAFAPYQFQIFRKIAKEAFFQASFCLFPLIGSLGKLQVRVWQPKRLAEPLGTFSGKQCMIRFLHY